MEENPDARSDPFQCSDILFRAVPYEDLVRKSDGVHKHQTFIRRSQQDPDGISLFTSIQDCKDAFEDPIFGIRSVHIGTLRDYELEAFRSSLTHANIRQNNGQNIPSRDDDHARAFQIADDLMGRSRPIAYWNDENADERFNAEVEAKRAQK